MRSKLIFFASLTGTFPARWVLTEVTCFVFCPFHGGWEPNKKCSWFWTYLISSANLPYCCFWGEIIQGLRVLLWNVSVSQLPVTVFPSPCHGTRSYKHALIDVKLCSVLCSPPPPSEEPVPCFMGCLLPLPACPWCIWLLQGCLAWALRMRFDRTGCVCDLWGSLCLVWLQLWGGQRIPPVRGNWASPSWPHCESGYMHMKGCFNMHLH